VVKVLLVAHWDWVLYNFRLPLARALRERGYEVVFVCPHGEYTHRLWEAGFRWRHWSVVRRSLNPLREFWAIVNLAQIYRQERPKVVHHFTIKPNLYGSIASLWVRKQNVQLKVINTFMGLGYLFSDYWLAQNLRASLLPFIRWTFQSSKAWTVFLNRQDSETLRQLCLVIPEQAIIIPSDGVDINCFRPNGFISSKLSTPVVLMAARLLWDKGVAEFVEAARILKQRGIQAEFWLAGKPDDGNPMCVPETILHQWHQEGLVNWLGHCDDMPSLLQKVDIAVLPSYHEGVPRFLLEAAASGLPLVATNIEGCRMVVRDGENGFLVPSKDPYALAEALERLIRNPELRLQMGKVSRRIVESEFDEQKILEQWLALYGRVLTECG